MIAIKWKILAIVSILFFAIPFWFSPTTPVSIPPPDDQITCFGNCPDLPDNSDDSDDSEISSRCEHLHWAGHRGNGHAYGIWRQCPE